MKAIAAAAMMSVMVGSAAHAARLEPVPNGPTLTVASCPPGACVSPQMQDTYSVTLTPAELSSLLTPGVDALGITFTSQNAGTVEVGNIAFIVKAPSGDNSFANGRFDIDLTPGEMRVVYPIAIPSDFTSLMVSGSFLRNDIGVDIALEGLVTVPLPASAPLFGAGLIVVGLAGYGIKRRERLQAA